MSGAGETMLSLDALFTTSGLLADRDGDGLPDTVHARLVVADGAGPPEHLAIVDFAARLGFESLAVTFPLVCTDPATIPPDAIPVYVGRPRTLPPACPSGFASALARLGAMEGLVAVQDDRGAALLVGGADEMGLSDAIYVVTACLTQPAPVGAAEDGLASLLRELRSALGDAAHAAVQTVRTCNGRVAELGLCVSTAAPDAVQASRAAFAYEAGTTDGCEIVVAGTRASGGPEQVLRISGPAIAIRPVAQPAPATAQPAPAGLRSLASIYGPTGLAVDTDGDLLPDLPRACIMLPDDLSLSEAAEAAHLGARVGVETLGLALPLARTGDVPIQEPGQASIVVAPLAGDDAPSLGPGQGELRLLDARSGGGTLLVRGADARGRAAALRYLAQLDPWTTADQPTLEQVEHMLQRICALVEPEAVAAATMAATRELPAQAIAPGSETLQLRAPLALPEQSRVAAGTCIADSVCACAPGLVVEADLRVPDAAPILDETHQLPWEVDEAWTCVTDQVVPALTSVQPRPRDWLLDIRVSEPEGRRRQLKADVLRTIRMAGIAATAEQVRVLPAYRQGRAWLLEEVAPLLNRREVATLTVRVCRFAPDYPCLELPIRWLQALHPVDELLCQCLSLPTGAVRFDMADLPNTYEVEARNANDETVWQSSFDVVYGRRAYLPGFPEWGYVHPPSGCVRLLIGGQATLDARITPDPERVWDLIQETLLPRLRRHILAVSDGTPRPEAQPFFGCLAVDAWLSEEDTALGVREERDSPLESLHEDLYFMLLDYCAATIGTAADGTPFLPPWVRPPGAGEPRRGARLWTAPGLIVPRVHRGDGAAPRVRMELTAAPQSQPRLTWTRGDQGGMIPLRTAAEVAVRVVGLRVTASGEDAHPAARHGLVALDATPEAQEQAQRLLGGWGQLRAAGALPASPIPHNWTLALVGQPSDGEVVIAASAPGAVAGDEVQIRPGTTDLTVARTAIPWDRVLGLSDVEAGLRALDQSPRARSYRAGQSAQGRPIYAVELTVPRADGIWSRAKMSAWKCTLLLNARHHANEPSSTSALLRLAALLAHDDAWCRYLDRVNVVLVPCENADGAALHFDLQQEHPTWMHHAARYNAAGLEFTAEYGKLLTRHTEALVLPELWRRWAPDIVCDDHGFPSHEWVQPCSGHSNPWFQSYWISQGLVFLILPRISSPRYPQHGQAADGLRRRLVGALAADPEIRARNSAYADRYRTFLNAWLPDAFPAPFEDDVLVHSCDYDPEAPGQGEPVAGFAGEQPSVTTASLITEVADETAQGRYMALCAHAHVLADVALLEYLYDANAPTAIRRERQVLPDGSVILRSVRQRPAVAAVTPLRDRPATALDVSRWP